MSTHKKLKKAKLL